MRHLGGRGGSNRRRTIVEAARGGISGRSVGRAVSDAVGAKVRPDRRDLDLDSVSLAVIGCGAWGPNHIRVFGSLGGSAVRVAVDPDPDRLERLRELHRSLELAVDPEAALADPEVNAVVVATPTSTHYDLVRRALEAGKHVLAEKPLAETSAQAEELVELARGQRVVLMVGHVFLFNAGVVKL